MMNPNLRVAYIDHDKPSGRYWSVLIRWDAAAATTAEVYRVELPGDPVGGKGMVSRGRGRRPQPGPVSPVGLARTIEPVQRADRAAERPIAERPIEGRFDRTPTY